ncbi:MAG: ferredoxin family protein [Oscillospiraceae bacterium]|nr:ferredoxin family protein [Oscillospiraceae bacterium]
MAERETYLAILKELQGTDAPKEVAEQIQAALSDPKATDYTLKSLCDSAAKKIVSAYPRKQVEWNPTVDKEVCIGCGKCFGFCKHGVYRMENGKAEVVFPEGCVVLCSRCMPLCPVEAITFPKFETYLELLRALRKRGR